MRERKSLEKRDSAWRAAFRVSGVYLLISSLWILFSDQAVYILLDDPAHITFAQSIKGWGFVLTSAFVIFALMHRELQRLRTTRIELDEQRLFLSDMMDNSPALMYMKDREGRYRSANRQFCEVLQAAWESLEGKTDADLFPAAAAEALRANDEQVFAVGEACDFREHVTGPDGSDRTYLSVKFPVRDAAGTITGICGISSDVTEREELGRKLEQNERLNALGRLTGGIAHDFNNHLSVICGNLELLQAAVTGNVEDVHCLHDAQRAATQAASLIDRLLAFSRNQMLVARNVDANTVVSDMRDLLARSLGESIPIQIELHPDALPCQIDPVQMESALLNLAVNARDAMPRGGTLRIRTRREFLDARPAAIDGVEPGTYACIDVEDEGVGIERDVLSRVLEPFFTTKAPGKGTGLGLSMVEGFARQSGGFVRLDSIPGKGTTVSILVPLVAAPGAVSGAQAVPVETRLPVGNGQVVLVVEDQDSLRRFATKVLEKHGYTVLHAESGVLALALMENVDRIDVLFSDVVLPGGMLGPELAQHFVRRYPRGKVIFTSGYADVSAFSEIDISANPLLRKPYGMAELLDTVNNSLRNNGGVPDLRSPEPELDRLSEEH